MTTPFEQALQVELVAAAERDQERRARRAQERPRRLRRIGLALLALAAAIGGALALTTLGPATADVEVRDRGDRVEVLFTDPSDTPAEVVRGIRHAGFPATIHLVPTGPSLVGRSLGAELDAFVREVQVPGPHGEARLGYSFPKGWTGRLVLLVGRPAKPGEGYQAGGDAFAKGEPLHCSGLRGVALGQVADRLHGFTVRVQTVDGNGIPGGQLTLDQAEASDYASWKITGGNSLSATSLLLRVEQDPAPPGADPTC